jgi:tetratricopeptide (TPR) repeat protein
MLTEERAINKLKVLPFKKDAGFFYKLSQHSFSKGNVADGVFYLKKAAQCEQFDGAYSLELAKTLSLISQYQQSNMIYLKLLAKGRKVGNCCFGLSQNLYYLNDLEHSLYYLNLYMDKYADDYIAEEEDEYIEIVEDSDIYEGYSIVYPMEKRDLSSLISHARGYMKKGMFSKAKSLLEKVPRENPDYIYARNNLALCCFFLNDYQLAKKYSEEVLEIDGGNVFALCSLAALYNYAEDAVNCALYLNKIINIKTSDIADLFKIATTLCELKEHALALKYLKTILGIKPYDINIMFLTAIAYYNNKKIKQAKEMFLSIIRLDEKNHAAKYYLKIINQTASDERDLIYPLEYICQVPYGEMLNRVKYLKSCPVKEIREIFRGEGRQSFLELCDWAFTLSDLKLQKTVAERLSAIKDTEAEEFLREKLLDPTVSNVIKRLIVEKFIIRRAQPRYDVCVDYVVKSFNPKLTASGNKVFYHAYALCCSKLMLYVGGGIENKVFSAYKKIVAAAKGCENLFTDKKALAAVIACRSKGGTEKIKKNMCRIFGADPAAFDCYYNMLQGKRDGKKV